MLRMGKITKKRIQLGMKRKDRKLEENKRNTGRRKRNNFILLPLTFYLTPPFSFFLSLYNIKSKQKNVKTVGF